MFFRALWKVLYWPLWLCLSGLTAWSLLAQIFRPPSERATWVLVLLIAGPLFRRVSRNGSSL